MPSHKPHFCIFGDSHFACLKAAVKEDLVPHSDVEMEFWGNVGNRFRRLGWRNDQVEPLDDFTAHRFAKFNEKKRTVLSAKDFDMILFAGCRITLYKLFPELLHRRVTPELRLSEGVEYRVISDFLRNLGPYQFARNFAAQKQATIVVAPISFDTFGFAGTIPKHFSNATKAAAKDREAIWDIVEQVMYKDGVILLRQDESSVVSGCCTAEKYGSKDYQKRNDPTHKNSLYGAMVLNAALDLFRGLTRGE
jgi:hypothetical protein